MPQIRRLANYEAGRILPGHNFTETINYKQHRRLTQSVNETTYVDQKQLIGTLHL